MILGVKVGVVLEGGWQLAGDTRQGALSSVFLTGYTGVVDL